MSDNDDQDLSFLEGQRNLNKNRKYSKANCIQFSCSQSVAVVMGITTLIVVMVIAILSAVSHPQSAPTNNNQTPKIEVVSSQGKFLSGYRLPANTIPIHYDLYFKIDFQLSKVTGRSRMDIVCVEQTQKVTLNLGPNIKISKLEVYNNEFAAMPIKRSLYHKKLEQLVIEMEKEVAKETELMIYIEYNFPLATKMLGLYRSEYKTSSGEHRPVAVTHFEPSTARYAFPCYDEPAMKATFRIAVSHDKKYMSRSNMPLLRSEEDGDWVTDHYQTTLKMSTYLVAVFVSDYISIEGVTNQNVKVRVNAPADHKDQLQLALKSAIAITEFYTKYFGTSFPLPKQDLIAIPNFAAGAMENWGLITYRMVSLLYDSNLDDDSQYRWVVVVVAHELAHQWFGNLVTMKWWNDLWLNEGFAALVEFIGSDHYEPPFEGMKQFVATTMQKAFTLDSLESSHPISVPVKNSNDINSIFDDISYDKGASILRMLQFILSEDTFKQGLKSYFRKYMYKNTETKDLWAEFSEASKSRNLNVESLMKTWIEHKGYPLVTVTRDGTSLKLSQMKFSLDAVSGNKEKSIWSIPMALITDVNKTPTTDVFDKANAIFNLDPKAMWFKLNHNRVGFYRVNYDDDTWDSMINLLQTDHQVLSESDRGNLVDDIFAISRISNDLLLKALNLSTYLTKETDYVPWKVAVNNLLYIGDRLMGTGVESTWKKYVLKLLQNVTRSIGFEDTRKYITNQLRSSVYGAASFYGDSDINKEGKKLFDDMMKGNKVGVNLKQLILKIGVREGGETEWNKCADLLKKTTNPREAGMLRTALATTKHTQLLEKYLKWSLNTSIIKSQDTAAVISRVANNPKGQNMAWEFVKRNFDTLYERYGQESFELSSIILSATSSFNTEEKLKDVKDFLSNHKLGSAQLAGKQAVEKIELHIYWLKQNKNKVKDWLARVL